jgi:short-subunit dehydrogenase
MKVKNKVIVVTGGGSGMGRELVLNLLSKGAKVVAIDINESSLQETAALAGSKNISLSTFVVDITDKASVEGFAKNAIARYGFVDGIINNAGIIQPFVKVNDLSYEAIERVIKVNLYGTLYMTKAFLPHLLTRPEAHIVNISSMGGFLPVPGQTIYGASKAAVKLLTEGLNSELANTNVKVTVVFPGAINTNISKNSGLSNPREASEENKSVKVLSPVKAAEIIVDGMEGNRYRVLVGKDAKFLDLFYRLNPKSAAKFIAQKMKTLLNSLS